MHLYAAGQGAILLGAGLMSHWNSMVPMALGASAGLMLSAPLVRLLWGRFVGRAS